MPSQVEKFLAGRPKGVSRVVKDGSGRLQSWVENGYAFVVSRDGSGKPLQVLGTSLRGTINSTFTYDGDGTLTGCGGDVIPGVFAEDLLRDANQLASSGAGGGVGGGGSTTVNNTLTSTSTTSALSAAQGKVLQDTKAPRGGPGAALGATYTAVDADDGKVWPTPVNCAVTVNAGLIAGFGQGFTGAGVVSFVAGAGVTFPADYDKRTSGAAKPVCSLVNIGLNTYEIWGTKA